MEITHVFRERAYWKHGRCKWFERCPVVSQSDKYVTVTSESYSTLCYAGGKFRLEIAKLINEGFHHHTRHGERFWLEQPEQGDLFPTQQLLDMPSVLDYEAIALGWDMGKDRPLEEWQTHCLVIAGSLEQPLKDIVRRWTLGGESALEQMWQEVRDSNKSMIDQLIERLDKKTEQ